MNKKCGLIVLLTSIFLNVGYAYASPSHSISVNRSQIEVGQSVTATVTLKNTAAWNIRVNGTGNTNGCSTSSADATSNGRNTTKTFKVTCSANSTGLIKISYSGDATSDDGSNTSIGGSKTVNVVAARPKSTNNYLKGLSIEGATISPEFNKDTLEYTALLEPGTEKVNIIAEKADGYASVSGAGEQAVVEGENKFDIVVTSESGQSRTYNLVITVKEFDPIMVSVNGNDYSVARKLDASLKPESFTETTIKIGEDTIQAFYNENTDITLVGLKDENGKILLFNYKDGKYTRYYEFKFNQLTINVIEMDKKLLPNGYSKYTALLNEEEIDVYKLSKDSNFALVYGIDVSTGKKNLYRVDLKNYTVQLYNDEFVDSMNESDKKNLMIFAALGGVILLEFLIILIFKGKNKKILNKIKDDKVEEVKTKAIKDAQSETVENEIEKKKKSKK